MRIAVLGTGIVGQTIGKKLVELGHEVAMGSRTATNEKAAQWATETGGQTGTFDEVSIGVEVIFNCTNGEKSLEALSSISPGNLDGKVLIDLANELEVVNSKPRSLASADNSLGAKIQNAFPNLRVVKTLNTVNTMVMVNPSLVPGYHNIFMNGDDDSAKTVVRELLESFGWPTEAVLDMGGIDNAVGPEMLMAFWLTVFLSGNGAPNANFNIAIVK
ncbi:MAG TPA: NAD(P)-binding domain-containing protein [Acidimicrobiia bacterium]|nr:NAD(P)-binding domain-containing protein [Acidimicrobiia bacterium]